MLWFIWKHQGGFRITIPFQNIICYGLSELHGWCHICGPGFQNIICYGLSEDSAGEWNSQVNFKTSYVMVYQFTREEIVEAKNISKHHMLWFIPTGYDYVDGNLVDFKTSYVMVYPSHLRSSHLLYTSIIP